jgi:hypothetical protein
MPLISIAIGAGTTMITYTDMQEYEVRSPAATGF